MHDPAAVPVQGARVGVHHESAALPLGPTGQLTGHMHTSPAIKTAFPD